MKLINKDSLHYIHEEDIIKIDTLKGKALKVRLSIIRYNKNKDENSLNSCCRNCNDIIKLIEEIFTSI